MQNGWIPFKTLVQRAFICAGIGFLGDRCPRDRLLATTLFAPPEKPPRRSTQSSTTTLGAGTCLPNGQFFDQDHVPRPYLATHLLITMPLVPLALYVVGIPMALINKRYAIIGALILPPAFLAIQFATEAQVYNGFRQFLFTIPFVCIGAGYGLVALGRLGRGVLGRTRAPGGLRRLCGLFDLQHGDAVSLPILGLQRLCRLDPWGGEPFLYRCLALGAARGAANNQ